MKEGNSNTKDILANILEYFISAAFLLSMHSIYVSTVANKLRINIVLVALLLLYIAFKFYIKDPNYTYKKIKKSIIKYKWIGLSYFLYFIIFALLNRTINSNFISTFIMILPMLFLIYSIDSKAINNFFVKLLKILLVVSVVSLVLYLFIDVLGLFKYTGKIYIDWGTKKYVDSFLGIYFKTQYTTFKGLIIPRNTSIFTEAPMYSLALIISLAFYEFIYKKKRSPIVRSILILSVLTTFSTTGYIAIIIIYVSKLLTKFLKGKNKTIKISFIAVLVVSVLISGVLLVNKLKTNSGSIRVDDYKACYKTWVNSNILYGAGYNNMDAVVANMSDFRSNNQGLSNSIMYVLAEGGILLFIVYLIPFVYSIYRSIVKKDYNVMYFSIIIGYLFITTMFCHVIIMTNILAIGYHRLAKDYLIR